MGERLKERLLLSFLGGVVLPLGVAGCVATRGWVHEQMTPMTDRVSDVERRVGQGETKLTQASARADRALDRLDRLRLDKQLVVHFRDGANFGSDSAALTQEARQQVDRFIEELQAPHDALLVVTGHTDGTGPEDYNYELGHKRATRVARYLISHKGFDPLRIAVVSYGASAPLADNRTREGRRKNRRIEIMVYQESITSSPKGRHLELQRSGRVRPVQPWQAMDPVALKVCDEPVKMC